MRQTYSTRQEKSQSDGVYVCHLKTCSDLLLASSVTQKNDDRAAPKPTSRAVCSPSKRPYRTRRDSHVQVKPQKHTKAGGSDVRRHMHAGLWGAKNGRWQKERAHMPEQSSETCTYPPATRRGTVKPTRQKLRQGHRACTQLVAKPPGRPPVSRRVCTHRRKPQRDGSLCRRTNRQTRARGLTAPERRRRRAHRPAGRLPQSRRRAGTGAGSRRPLAPRRGACRHRHHLLVRAAARDAGSGRGRTSKARRGRARSGHSYRSPAARSTHPSLELSSSAMAAAARRPGAGGEGGAAAAAAGSAANDSATAAAPAITGSSLGPARPPPASSPRRPARRRSVPARPQTSPPRSVFQAGPAEPPVVRLVVCVCFYPQAANSELWL